MIDYAKIFSLTLFILFPVSIPVDFNMTSVADLGEAFLFSQIRQPHTPDQRLKKSSRAQS